MHHENDGSILLLVRPRSSKILTINHGTNTGKLDNNIILPYCTSKKNRETDDVGLPRHKRERVMDTRISYNYFYSNFPVTRLWKIRSGVYTLNLGQEGVRKPGFYHESEVACLYPVPFLRWRWQERDQAKIILYPSLPPRRSDTVNYFSFHLIRLQV